LYEKYIHTYLILKIYFGNSFATSYNVVIIIYVIIICLPILAIWCNKLHIMSLGLIHLHVVMRKYAIETIIKYSELERNNATHRAAQCL